MGLKLSTTDMDQSTLMDSCTVGFGISMVHYEMSSMEVQQLLLPYSKDVLGSNQSVCCFQQCKVILGFRLTSFILN